MRTTFLPNLNFVRPLLFCITGLFFSLSNTYAQTCKLNNVAMYGWMGDSDGHTAATNIDNSTSDDEDGDDWISFVNRGTTSVDISGWQLYTDQFYKEHSNSFATAAFTFPSGTVLSPGEKVFVIAQWDGGSIRDGWYSANFNEGEGFFEETSNNEAWAILRNPTSNAYITIHQQGVGSAGMSLPSPATKECNVNVTNLITNDFEGCEVVLLNESTGAYYEQTNCSYSSFPDSDGDGTPDVQDDDIDNDGIINPQDKLPNDTDNDGTPNPSDNDKDGDGILDVNEAAGKILDTDNDGTPNKTDTDDDADGLLDTAEIGVLDSDGKYTLPDSDGDGLPDLADPLDTDGDGVPNHIDLDDDNDGIVDTVEGNTDTDSDGIINRLDLDSDNDGISDLQESGNPGISADTNNDGTVQGTESEVGTNGIPLSLEGGTEGGSVPAPKNTDGDSLPDYIDPRSDGTTDDIDLTTHGALDANNDGKIDTVVDADKDGIADSIDANSAVFGGLAALVANNPDLRPLITMVNRTFVKSTDMSRPFTIKIGNVGGTGSTTTGVITVFVSVGSAYSIALDGTSSWTLVDQGAGNYVLTASVSIPRTVPATTSDIALILTAKSTVAKGIGNISVQIDDNAGGEQNSDNNGVTADIVVTSL